MVDKTTTIIGSSEKDVCRDDTGKSARIPNGGVVNFCDRIFFQSKASSVAKLHVKFMFSFKFCIHVAQMVKTYSI